MNIIEKILGIRLLDGILQYTNNNKWKTIVNSVDNRTAGFNLELSDVGKYIRINNSGTVNVTISNKGFLLGSSVTFEQVGAGSIVMTAGTGITLNGNLNSGGQYKCLQIINVAPLEWTVIGGIAGD